MTRSIAAGLAIAAVQAALVASLGIQAAIDRHSLPRAWVQARPEGSATPAQGRYLRVPIVPLIDPDAMPKDDMIDGRTVSRPTPVSLEARDGRLVAHRAAISNISIAVPRDKKEAGPVLRPALEYFVPAGGDPAHLAAEADLWIEVSVPPKGSPRALRLGRMKDGKIVPLAF